MNTPAPPHQAPPHQATPYPPSPTLLVVPGAATLAAARAHRGQITTPTTLRRADPSAPIEAAEIHELAAAVERQSGPLHTRIRHAITTVPPRSLRSVEIEVPTFKPNTKHPPRPAPHPARQSTHQASHHASNKPGHTQGRDAIVINEASRLIGLAPDSTAFHARHIPPQPRSTTASMLVFALEHADAEHLARRFDQAGLTLDAILPLTALPFQTPRGSDARDVVTIHADADATRFTLTIDAQPVFDRVLPDASLLDALANAAPDEPSIPPALAAALDPAIRPTDWAFEAAQSFLQRLVAAAESCLTYTERRFPGATPTHLRLVGDLARQPAFAADLARSLALETIDTPTPFEAMLDALSKSAATDTERAA